MEDPRIPVVEALYQIHLHAHCIQYLLEKCQCFGTTLALSASPIMNNALTFFIKTTLPSLLKWILQTYLELITTALVHIQEEPKLSKNKKYATQFAKQYVKFEESEWMWRPPNRGWRANGLNLQAQADTLAQVANNAFDTQVTKTRARTEKTRKRFQAQVNHLLGREQECALLLQIACLPRDLANLILSYTNAFCTTCWLFLNEKSHPTKIMLEKSVSGAVSSSVCLFF